jgi:hypothetical protein
MTVNEKYKAEILTSLDSTKGQQIDEEGLVDLLDRGETLLGNDWEEWLTTNQTSLGDSPLNILKKGGINLGAIERMLNDIEYTIRHKG